MLGKDKKGIDMAVIAIGVALMVCLFCFQQKADEEWNYLISFVGVIGLVYLGRVLYLYLWKRIEFDYHLVKGHYLQKVISLVVLLPFVLTMVMFVCGIENDPAILLKDEGSMYGETEKQPALFWAVYSHFIDPGNQFMAHSMAGRAWAALFAILGVFLLNGLLVSSIVGWIDRHKEEWEEGKIRYKLRFLKKHHFAVVIGANEIVASVVKNLLTVKHDANDINYLCEGDNHYVILQTGRDVQKVRDELASYLSEEEMKKVIIYNAKRDSKRELEHLYLAYASEIYVLGESSWNENGETYHDAMNMRCVNLIAEDLEKTREQRAMKDSDISVRRVCKVMFDYQTTYSIFQYSDASENVNRNLVFIPFNQYESWARRVIVENSSIKDPTSDELITYTPLDGAGFDKDSEEFVHFIIVGMSKIGIAMGVQAMHNAHYLNCDKARTRITFIDSCADKEMAFFKGRYESLFELIRHRYVDANAKDDEGKWIDPIADENSRWRHLSSDGKNFLDVEVEFIKGDLESEGVRDYLRRAAADEKSKITIAICLCLTHQAVAAALYMPIEVYKDENLQEIWVYQRESADIIANLQNPVAGANDIRYKKLRPFGMQYGEYMSDRLQYLKALLTSGVYSLDEVTDLDMGREDTYKIFKDGWKKLSIYNKWSNKYYVDSIYTKLRNIMLGNSKYSTPSSIMEMLKKDSDAVCKEITKALAKNEDLLAVCEHNRWNMQQLLMGFRPCVKEIDAEFVEMNSKISDAKVKAAFKKKKDELKGNDFIHPNICDFKHLDSVESGAKDYDKKLNNAIPRIITLVDGHTPKIPETPKSRTPKK